MHIVIGVIGGLITVAGMQISRKIIDWYFDMEK